MFNIMELRDDLSSSIQEDLDGIINSSRMEISREAAGLVSDVLSELFRLNPDGTIAKPPKDFGDNFEGHGVINIMPSTSDTRRITDTLVFYCMGSDNLNTKLADMLIAVGKYRFKNIFFVTSKWDVAAVTGNNIQRLHDIIELSQDFATFCFILESSAGISRIPVI